MLVILVSLLWTVACSSDKAPSVISIKESLIEQRSIDTSINLPSVTSLIDSIIRTAIKDSIIPGAIISIYADGQVIIKKSYGYAFLKTYPGILLSQPEPMTVAHLFDLASLTKVFATTMATMILVDEGEIKIDDKVSTYIACFNGEHKDSITIRHLLTHTSGLAQWKPVYYHARSRESSITFICSLPLSFPVGKMRRYSDLGFMLLGHIAEAVSGQRLDRFLDEKLYGPLGLQNTIFIPNRATYPYAATSHGNPFEKRMVSDDSFGYLCDENPEDFKAWRKHTLIGEVNDGNAFHAFGGVAGHAGLFSSVEDLQLLMNLLLNDGRHRQSSFIDSSTIAEFLRKDNFGHGFGWAMGNDVLPLSDSSIHLFGHTGFTGTYAIGFPERKVSLVLLTNRQNLGVNERGYYPSVNDLRKDLTDVVVSNWIQSIQ